nr:hypothetical protein [Clostridia bacterium]
MKITYLGTAAAEAIPALFCQCAACETARKKLGKEFRCRNAVLIDDSFLIDFPPDIYCSTIRAGVYLPGIKNIIFTHSHTDHCTPSELAQRLLPVTCKRFENDNEPLHIYGNEAVLEKCKGLENKEDKGIVLHYIAPFTPTEIGGYTVTALLADHAPTEVPYFYLIEKDGKRFINGNDTGIFPEKSLEYLRGKRCDAISLDCTNVMLDGERGHMGLKADIKLKKMLLEQGTADEDTYFICHHFSHNGFMPGGVQVTLEEFEAKAAEAGFDVSYDTMAFEI